MENKIIEKKHVYFMLEVGGLVALNIYNIKCVISFIEANTQCTTNNKINFSKGTIGRLAAHFIKYSTRKQNPYNLAL